MLTRNNFGSADDPAEKAQTGLRVELRCFRTFSKTKFQSVGKISS
jgi:hypothetical protein